MHTPPYMEMDLFLAGLPLAQQAVCERLHALCCRLMPTAHQMVYHGAMGYAVSASPMDRVMYIAPQRDWVNLGFFYGGFLPDPEQLLKGAGKRMRHIKVRSVQEAGHTGIATLVAAAWQYGKGPATPSHHQTRP